MSMDESLDNAAPGGDYNLLPYLSLPIAYTQPAHLAALAALFGLDAPAAQGAQVLELGCASGGNIIPLAARFPRAHFVGIDLAPRHIDEGRRRIAALRLGNVELRQGDLAHIALGGQKFDYVICHGVFSWVPKVAQDAIFRVCRDVLAANGMAAISYNVFPGWHLRRIVRDICLHHVGSDGEPRDRVARARALLEEIAKSSRPTEAYGLLLRNEAKRAAKRPASYILGEFLAQHNEPCYFREFAERAAAHGLSYLCEGDLAASIRETRTPEIGARIRALAGSSPLAFEQYADFFTGRTFRRSVLIREQQAAAVRRERDPQRLRGLHFAAELRRDARGGAIRAKDPAVRRALSLLAERYPATVALEELAAPGTDERVSKLLFGMLATGEATASVLPLRTGRATAERPLAWSLARAEAAAGQRWVTSLRHSPTPLQPDAAFLLPQLDGTKHRQELSSLLSVQRVEQVLGYFARNALLEPE
jgi:SAM-dependent methyltransferase